MLRGAIFDWDGVVVDSSTAHRRSWELLAGETGRSLPHDHFERGFGRKNEFIIPEILGWTRDPAEVSRLSRRKEALFREVIAVDGLTLCPGARELLAELRGAAIPCAVGSSTQLANIEVALSRLDLHGFFTGIITAEDVHHGKPHPEVFLKAAAALGVPPEDCVVFEDATFGIEAALAGGMRAVGVATTYPAEMLHRAHRVVPLLTQVSIPWLRELWS